MQTNFKSSNLNFVARLIIFALSVLALIGVKFPDDPTTVGTDIATTLSTGGFIAVVGILAVSVIMPIYNFARTKPKVNIWSVLGSPNFWIYAATFVFGILTLNGINIPEGTSEQLIAAIYAKDWTNLATIAIANILDPLIRYFRDKRNGIVANV
jgi:hypothetical protein